MARARNIKPGLYKNEDLAECSIWARYIFPGLWTLADREGRLEDRPKRIKGELLPFDAQDVEPLLRELAAKGFIVRYQIDAVGYIQIVAFKRHQSPHYTEKNSVIKPPELREDSGSNGSIKEGSKPPDSLIPDSLIPDSRTLSAVADGAFPKFWQAYPRKTAKKKAHDVFKRLRVDDALLDVMLNAIKAQKESEQWRRGVIPHASTWLNQRRWEDEIQTTPTRAVDTTCAEIVAGEKCGMPASMRGGGIYRCDHHERQRHERSRASMPDSAKKALAEFKRKGAAT